MMEELDKGYDCRSVLGHIFAVFLRTGILPKVVEDKLVYVGNFFKDRRLYDVDV